MVAILQSAAHSAVDYDPFADGELARVVSTTEPQREVWLADQLGEDASLAFNESSSLRLCGKLDRDALHVALEQLVARHDALRSTFGPDGESLCVRPVDSLALPFTDLASMDASARDAALAARLRSVVETPFRLDRDALFRAELLRLSEDEHLLVLTAHHIVCDGWSWWVLVQDLATLYAIQCGSETGPLPAAEAFSDYAVAEAAHVAGKASAADEAYWLSRFADGAPVLDLPTDRPRPSRRSFASRREDYVIDADLVAAVRRMGARRGSSMFATLLAGFASVVSRLAGQSQVIVGIPAAGQSVGGHDHLVGHCVNLLPLRFELDPAQPFQQLLGDAQKTLLDAIEHQRYTFGTLLQKVKVERDPARLPLVSVMFNIDQALERETTGFPGLSMDFRSNPRSYENFEIFINAVHAHGALTLECQYNTDLFDATTIRRWLSAYESLLRDAVERPEAAASSLSLVDADAVAELAALQPEPVEFDRQRRMHESFEIQCDRDPDRVALEFRGESLSYAALEARANRIAHLLRARGVKRGGLVGIALDRGIDMLAGLLGVLKAGAGYVPLDPQFPAERLAYMAGDAGLAALLTQRSHAAQFDLRGRPVLMLDQLDEELATMPSQRIGRDDDAAAPESVAYVIYTSGSTGRPKGVQVPHRAVANFLVGMQREPGIGPDDRLVAVTTLSFDIAVLELMLPLSIGARVVLADRDTAVDGGALKALLVSSGATLMQATPATWRLLLEADWAGHPSFAILCGGEPLPPDLATQLLPRCGALWNMYGPTETTVWSTIARVEQLAGQHVPDIHIGHPIANTRIWIVDEQGGLCPRGVAGEICIGGDGVTLGYLQRPELTADRFVPDRFAGASSERAGQATPLLYRTGDRGRWRADGNLEHLGRLDFQVKVRGYRIELGEIENNLASHPDVARVVVVAREDRPGDVRLVAYVVPQAGRPVDESALVAHLRGALPDYMIPQHVMALEAVPLLPNGKVDRKGLPAPDATIQRKTECIAPRNDLERKIADTMASVLGVTEISVEDDFFAAGGHSLLAAQLTSRLNRELGVALSLRALFDAPTVARLARKIAEADGEPAPVHAPIPRRADQSRAPLSLIQERLRMLEEFNPGQPTYNTPSAHTLHGPLDAEVFERAFRAMVQRQTVLRTTIGEENGEPVQIVHEDFDTGLLPVVDMRSIPADRREGALNERLAALVAIPFDLGKPPLFTARLYRMDEQRHVLMFMPHHIVWDGWSFDLLYTDIAEFYQAFLEDREPKLPELPVTYGDFAAWHREWVKGPEYAAQLEFWRTHLGGRNLEDSRKVKALPTDHPRRPGMSGRASSHKFEIPAALVEKLRGSGLKIEATMFVTLLAAYFTLLHGVSGQNHLIVSTPVRGRHRPEVESMMGYFANLLPLRMEIDPSVSFADVVKATKDLVLDSLGNPDIRLEDLMSELSVRTASGGRMLYQSLFSFQDIRQRELSWGNVTHERRALPHPGVTEDLAIWFVEELDRLSAAVVYNTELFRPESADLLHQRYLAIIEAVAADPFQPIAALTRFEGLAPLELKDWDDTATSKVEALRADVAATTAMPRPAGAIVTDDDPLLVKLALVWSELVGLESVAPDDDFFALGGNSLQAVQMFQQARQLTGTNLPLATLLAAPTLRGLTAAYRDAGAIATPTSISNNPASSNSASNDPWAPLVPIRVEGTRPPLFLAHAVGGNVLNYQQLAKKLPADQPVYGLQAIGLDGHTPPLQRVEDMARRYVAEIRQVQPEGPYHLAGGSMGGIIAYEMAQQLAASGQRVAMLGLIDTSADYGERCRREALGGWRAKLRNRMAGRSWRERLAVVRKSLASRKNRLVLRLKMALARRIGAEIPHADRYAGVEAVHRKAYEQYAVRPYAGNVVLFRAEDQPASLDGRATLGWEQLVESVQVVSVPGSHVGLVEAPEMPLRLEEALVASQGGPNAHVERKVEASATTAGDSRDRYLMALWKELLDADVQPGDNFFDAGGHSMLAVQMTDRVYRETGVRLNMMRLASWTLSQLAAELPASTGVSAGMSGAVDGKRPTAAKGLMRMFRASEAASQ